MTEEDAKTKWCPFVRPWECGGQSWVPRPISSDADQGLMTADKALCIASDCMAWRTTGGGTLAFVKPLDNQSTGEKTGWMFAEDGLSATLPPSGYCGLAGKPE